MVELILILLLNYNNINQEKVTKATCVAEQPITAEFFLVERIDFAKADADEVQFFVLENDKNECGLDMCRYTLDYG